MVTEVDVPTGLVLTVKVALVAPSSTVTLAGTVAAAVLLLESVTCAPPAGAGPLSVTVPVEGLPPVTLVGFKLRERRVTAWTEVLISDETLLERKLATARSGPKSPLNSPTATDTGPLPALKVSAAWNVPSPLPKRTETVVERKLATARSRSPSPLKSPTSMDAGPSPTRRASDGRKVPSPFPSATETVVE